MLKGAIARRYAGAIFDLGLKQNALDRTLDDVREIAQVFANRKLSYLLLEPKIPAQRKEKAIRQALANKVLPTSLNLALLLVQRELIEAMPNIARELENLVLDYKNQAVAEVTTATNIDDVQKNLIKQALEKQTGKTILIETRVRPEILGGVVARVGDKVIDGSIRHRLNVLRQRLLNSATSSTGDFLQETDLGVDGNTANAKAASAQQDTQDTAQTSNIQ
jgi:F-type H+-transporting ATPase subunit delta